MKDDLKRFIRLIPDRYKFNAEECAQRLFLQARSISNVEFGLVQKARSPAEKVVQLCDVIADKVKSLNSVVANFADVIEQVGNNKQLACDLRLELQKANSTSHSTNFKYFGDFQVLPKSFFRRNEWLKFREALTRLCTKQKSGALAVYGPKGVGKTSLVGYVLTDENFLLRECGVDSVIWLNCRTFTVPTLPSSTGHLDRDLFYAHLLAGLLEVDILDAKTCQYHMGTDALLLRLKDAASARQKPVLIVLDNASDPALVPLTLQLGSMIRCVAICDDKAKLSFRRDDWLVLDTFGVEKLVAEDVRAMLSQSSVKFSNYLNEQQLKLIVDCSDGLALMVSLISANFEDCFPGSIEERFRHLTDRFQRGTNLEDMLQSVVLDEHLQKNAVELFRAVFNILPAKSRYRFEAFLLFNAEQPLEPEDLAVMWRCTLVEASEQCVQFFQRSLVLAITHIDTNGRVIRKYAVHPLIHSVATNFASGRLSMTEFRSRLVDSPPSNKSENLLHLAIKARRHLVLETILANVTPSTTLPKLCGEPTGDNNRTPLHYLYTTEWRWNAGTYNEINFSLVLFCQFVDKLAQMNKDDTMNTLRIEDASGVSVVTLIRRQVDACRKAEDNVLYVAARTGLVSLTDVLLSCSVDVDARDDEGDPALIIAAESGKVAVAQLLIGSGVDVNTRNANGYTALMIAALHRNLELAQLFFDCQANINAKNKAGDTALTLAALHGDADFVEAFLENGANVNEKNSRGESVLLLCARDGNCDVAWKIVICGADVNAKNLYGFTPLIVCAQNGFVEFVSLLLAQPAIDLNARNVYQQTALMTAAMGGHAEVVELLLDRQADVDAYDLDGNTALILAAGQGRIDVTRLLLDRHPACACAKNNENKTALEMATQNGHTNVVQLFVEHERHAATYFSKNCSIQ